MFGHTRFLIKDGRLLAPLPDTGFLVATIKDINGKRVTTRTTGSSTYCVTYDVCATKDPGLLPAARTTTGQTCTTTTVCTESGGTTGDGWTGSGTGTGDSGGTSSGGTSGGSTGGTNTGWWTGSPCNVRKTAVVIDPCGSGWTPVSDPSAIDYSNDNFDLPFPGENQLFLSENPNATDCRSFDFVTTSADWQEAGIKNVKLRIIYTGLDQIRKSVFIELNQVVIGLSTRWSASKAQNMAAKPLTMPEKTPSNISERKISLIRHLLKFIFVTR